MQDVKFLFSEEIVKKLKYFAENKMTGFIPVKIEQACLQTKDVFMVLEEKPETIKSEKNIKKSRKFSIPMPKFKPSETKFWEKDNFAEKNFYKSKSQRSKKPSRNFRFIKK